jgi:hypothetical protein
MLGTSAKANDSATPFTITWTSVFKLVSWWMDEDRAVNRAIKAVRLQHLRSFLAVCFHFM